MAALALSKGTATREAVLNQALELSSVLGLEGLSLGVLAKKTGLSKSGLYAHFASKEKLQLAVLDTAAQKFVADVMRPAFAEPRGLPRVTMLFERWTAWDIEQLSGGCPWISASADFDDRPGPVRDLLAEHITTILDAVARAARISVEEGHFAKDLDTEQFAYECWGLILAHHHHHRLLDSPQALERASRGFHDLVERSRAS